MFRDLFFFIFLLYTSLTWSLNYTVGTNSTNGCATLWITDPGSSSKPLTNTEIPLSNQPSAAMSICVVGQELYIVGINNNKAYLWITDLKGTISLQQLLSNTASSKALSVIYGGNFTVYIGGSDGTNSALWKLPTRGTFKTITKVQNNCTPLSSNIINDLIIYGGTIYCGGNFNNYGALYIYNPNDVTPALNLKTVCDAFPNSNVQSLAYNNKLLYLVGSYNQNNNDIAALWTLGLSDTAPKVKNLISDAYESYNATSVVVIGNTCYISVYGEGALYGGVIVSTLFAYDITSGNSSQLLPFFYGELNFLTATGNSISGYNFPLYTCGSIEQYNGTFEACYNVYSKSLDRTDQNFLSGIGSAANAMIINVQPAVNNIPVVLKSNKITSIQLGVSR